MKFILQYQTQNKILKRSVIAVDWQSAAIVSSKIDSGRSAL